MFLIRLALSFLRLLVVLGNRNQSIIAEIGKCIELVLGADEGTFWIGHTDTARVPCWSVNTRREARDQQSLFTKDC